MRIRQLQTFCDLAETLNYTRTAERLHYAQSSVMEQMKALEDHFGVPLIERAGRQLRLTPAGALLREEAERLVRLAQQMRERVRAQDSAGAALSVLAPETFCVRRLPAMVRGWRAAWPDVQVTAGPASRTALAVAVEEGRADVAVMLGVPGGVVTSGAAVGVSTTYLASEELLLVARTGHPLAHAGTRDDPLPALADYPLYASEPGCAYRAASDAVLQPLGYVPELVCGSVAAVVESVAATDGVALLPRMAVEGELGRRLCVIDLGQWPRVPVVMRWRADDARPQVAAFAAAACALT